MEEERMVAKKIAFGYRLVCSEVDISGLHQV
jgi:hypothetical protein